MPKKTRATAAPGPQLSNSEAAELRQSSQDAMADFRRQLAKRAPKATGLYKKPCGCLVILVSGRRTMGNECPTCKGTPRRSAANQLTPVDDEFTPLGSIDTVAEVQGIIEFSPEDRAVFSVEKEGETRYIVAEFDPQQLNSRGEILAYIERGSEAEAWAALAVLSAPAD